MISTSAETLLFAPVTTGAAVLAGLNALRYCSVRATPRVVLTTITGGVTVARRSGHQDLLSHWKKLLL